MTKYRKQKIRKQLIEYYVSADQISIIKGRMWYKNAHAICAKMAEEFNYDIEIVVHVLSALSPRNTWERNITDTATVLDAVNQGLSPEDVKVSTFHSNKRKAFAIARGELTIQDSSLKTFSFVKNIAELNSDHVTVDIWHLRACFGNDADHTLVNTRPKYKTVEEITKRVAKQFNEKPHEFQAIIWEHVRTNWSKVA